ncbi:uncharacterized protein F4807DRAFT_408473 [Annulohypoxylon truncatum]|uniref:uncharacterized protein n=1 Tax=Annulohypoxylon truncatum TaxID=327061 RepID=UPI002007EE66|nr:uncharacterized protein F4807DRAFT_408473 [Annulohypoxylon truncatum]KAI1213618.1 hypothetical protein F4807DRAFT_408473 [Annulohypoxylon truncatum]
MVSRFHGFSEAVRRILVCIHISNLWILSFNLLPNAVIILSDETLLLVHCGIFALCLCDAIVG